MILLAIIAIALGTIFGLGLGLGAMIHHGHPVTEHPIRTVKLRGDVVDMVL